MMWLHVLLADLVAHVQVAARAAWRLTWSAISLAVAFTVQLGPILRLYIHLRRLAVERQDACQLVCATAAGRRRIVRVIARFYVAASAAGRTRLPAVSSSGKTKR